MGIRRCAAAWLEPREVASFQLDDLLAGGTGVVSRLAWFAHAPHLDAAVEVDDAHVLLLGALGPVDWIDPAEAIARRALSLLKDQRATTLPVSVADRGDVAVFTSGKAEFTTRRLMQGFGLSVESRA